MEKIVCRIMMGGIIFLGISSGIVYSFYFVWYAHYSFILHFDFLFSQQACSAIKELLDSSQYLYSMHQVMNDLQKHFSCIKSISYEYKFPSVYYIFISSHVPYIVLNSTHVITDQGLELQSYFNTEYLKKLPYIRSKDIISLQMCHTLLSIPSDIFKQYSLTWHNQSKILLMHKQQQKCVIFADKNSLTDISKIKKALHLYTVNKSNKNYIYDIRFDNQILKYVMKGEVT